MTDDGETYKLADLQSVQFAEDDASSRVFGEQFSSDVSEQHNIIEHRIVIDEDCPELDLPQPIVYNAVEGEDATNTSEKNAVYLELAKMDFPTSSTAKNDVAHQRPKNIIRERKNEHKKWREVIDGYAQYTEWVNKKSIRLEDMPDVGDSSSMVSEETEDFEADYYTSVDSLRNIVDEIERSRGEQTLETADSDAKLEEILKGCEERMKTMESDSKSPKKYHVFICFLCGRVFDEEKEMRDHINDSHIDNKDHKFKCKQCNRRFKCKHHLERHEKTHDLSLVHSCDQCSTSFRKFETLIAHKRKVHGQDAEGKIVEKFSHRCSKCCKNFATFVGLARHKQYCLNVNDTKKTSQSSDDNMSDAVTVTSELSLYSASGRPKIDNTCPKCNTKFASRQSLLRHFSRIHKSDEIDQTRRYQVIPSSPYLPFACIECGKRFASKPSLSLHKRRHAGALPYECETCGRKYPMACELRKHVNRAHKI